MTTLTAKIKAIQSVTAGNYVKFERCYYTNAYPGVYTEKDGKAWLERSDDFQIMIEKEDGLWVVYTEEHEPSDLEDFDDTKNGFKTLAAAKQFAEEFGRYYVECCEEADAA